MARPSRPPLRRAESGEVGGEVGSLMTDNYAFIASGGEPDTDAIGIALSGGGVRAAALGLGVLQVADENHLLSRARFVSAVSGGTYIAAAYMASRALPKDESSRLGLDSPAPWSRGSPEEKHLRQNLKYLVEDWGDFILSMVRYLVGLALNILPLLAGVVFVGATCGVILDSLGFLARTDETIEPARGVARALLVASALLAAAALERISAHSRLWTKVRRGLAIPAMLGTLPELIVLVVSAGQAKVDYRPVLTWIAAIGAVLIVTLLLVLRTQWAFAIAGWRRWTRGILRLLLALSCGTAVLVPFLYSAAFIAKDTTAWKGILVLSTSASVLILGGLVLHANSTSMHSTYARRLTRAYIVRAARAPDDKNVWLDEVTLESLTRPGSPELICCAAVNLRERESAHGEGCASFVFTPRRVGSPALEYLSVPEFRRRVGHAEISTLSVLIAASGAAVAPSMGRFTRKSGRLALAMVNWRLGLWIRNPFVGALAVDGGRDDASLPQHIKRAWLEPGPLATIQEALGALSLRGRALFISDGGHWDNSGIVELLRRRCNVILALDASNDARRLGNLLRALALARVELGVEFDTDAGLLDSQQPVIRLRFRYPDDSHDGPERHLVLMRTFISSEMPADLVELSRGGGRFPRHSTTNQFFSAREFDAYVSLGRWLCAQGIMIADIPPAADPRGWCA